MSDLKILTVMTFILFCTLVSWVVTLRVSDHKVRMMALKVKDAEQYCLGKENRIKFCYDLMSKK